MKEIVRRLQEKRNIEVAKSILETKGYKVTKRLKESLGNWDAEFRVDGYGDPYPKKEYRVAGNSRYRGFVRSPEDVDEEERDYRGIPAIDSYQAEIWDDEEWDTATGTEEFDTEEEAKRWVENWFIEHSNLGESKRYRGLAAKRSMQESRKLRKSKYSDSTRHTEEYKGYSIQSYDQYGATIYQGDREIMQFATIDDAIDYIDGLEED